MKFFLLPKKTISLVSAISTGCLGTGVATAGIVYTIDNINAKERIIPSNWLSFSKDKLTVTGFQPWITISDIAQGHYNTLEIPEGVETIDSYAFSYMFDAISTRMTTIQFPESLKTIKDGAFIDCNGITNLIFKDKKTGKSNLQYIGREAFKRCPLTEHLEIPDTVTTIGDSAFEGCILIKTVFIPKSVTNMGTRVFYNCYQCYDIDLTDYGTLPNWAWSNLQTFSGAGTSSKISNVVHVCLKDCTLNDWEEALYGRQSLPRFGEMINGFKIQIEKYLEEKYFDIDKEKGELKGFTEDVPDLSNYSVIKIPENVLTIAKNAFFDDDDDEGMITNCKVVLELDDELLTIEENAFRNCSGIWSVDTENCFLSEIQTKAFAGCTSLEEFVVTKTFETIKNNAFQGCTNLRKLTFVDDCSNMEMDYAAFADCSKLSDIYLTDMEEAPSEWYWKSDPTRDKTLPFDSIAPYGTVHVPHGSTIDWNTWFERWGISTFNDVEESLTVDNTYWVVDDNDLADTFDSSLFYFGYGNKLLAGLNERGKELKQDLENLSIDTNAEVITDNAFNEEFQYFERNTENGFWDLTFNEGLKEIGSFAFQGCTGFYNNLSLPDTLETIGYSAFDNCSYFRGTLSLPNQLKKIGPWAFANCLMLYSDNLVLPSNTELIGTDAFSKTHIEQITIPKAPIEQIMANAFWDIDDLKTIDLSAWKCDDLKAVAHDQSFRVSSEEGKILVNSDASDEEITQWTECLRILGLPNTWDVERK